MKKLKMFGFTLMAMLVGIASTSAVELGGSISTDGKLAYTKEADETFSYEVIRISKAEWDSVSGEVASNLEKVANNTEQLEKDYASYENAVRVYESALQDYNDSQTEENKTILDMAEADMNACLDYIEISLNELKSSMTVAMASIKKVAPYTSSMTEVSGTETTGEITVNMDGAAEDDVFVVWIKSDDYGVLSDDNVLIGEVYTKDGILAPELPSDVEIPTTPTNNETAKTEENVKNPKTGVSMPVALGFGIVALAGAGMFIVCKKQLFKQL